MKKKTLCVLNSVLTNYENNDIISIVYNLRLLFTSTIVMLRMLSSFK
jgi:hypothetical protein